MTINVCEKCKGFGHYIGQHSSGTQSKIACPDCTDGADVLDRFIVQYLSRVPLRVQNVVKNIPVQEVYDYPYQESTVFIGPTWTGKTTRAVMCGKMAIMALRMPGVFLRPDDLLVPSGLPFVKAPVVVLDNALPVTAEMRRPMFDFLETRLDLALDGYLTFMTGSDHSGPDAILSRVVNLCHIELRKNVYKPV